MRPSVKFLKEQNVTELRNDLAKGVASFKSDRRELIRDNQDLIQQMRAYRYTSEAEQRARNALIRRNKELLRQGKELINIKANIAYAASPKHDTIEGTSETFMLLMDRIVSKEFSVERRDSAMIGEYFLLEDSSVPRISISIPLVVDVNLPLSRSIRVKVDGSYMEIFTQEELTIFYNHMRVPIIQMYEQTERYAAVALEERKRQSAHDIILGLYKEAGIK